MQHNTAKYHKLIIYFVFDFYFCIINWFGTNNTSYLKRILIKNIFTILQIIILRILSLTQPLRITKYI